MTLFFDESYYIKSKLAQLAKAGETDSNGNAYTEETLIAAIEKIGLTVKQHYDKYSLTEGTSANPYFNVDEYLKAKTEQLNSINYQGRTWTVEDTIEAFKKAGLNAEQHYIKYGSHETDADGNLINPSNAFDANAYVSAKLAQCKATDPDTWGDATAEDIVDAIAGHHMSLVDHYERFGRAEAKTSGIDMVQSVPVADRVANDVLREATGENVASNYNSSSLSPSVVGKNGTAVTKPYDIAVDEKPDDPVLTPYDPYYVTPPDVVVDTNERNVVKLVINAIDGNNNDISAEGYGIAKTNSETGNVTVYAIGEDGKPDIESVPLQTKTYNAKTGETTTVTTLKDFVGNTFTSTTTSTGANEANTAINVTFIDGSSISATGTEKTDATGAVTTDQTFVAKDVDGSKFATITCTCTETELSNGSEHRAITKSFQSLYEEHDSSYVIESTSTTQPDGSIERYEEQQRVEVYEEGTTHKIHETISREDECKIKFVEETDIVYDDSGALKNIFLTKTKDYQEDKIVVVEQYTSKVTTDSYIHEYKESVESSTMSDGSVDCTFNTYSNIYDEETTTEVTKNTKLVYNPVTNETTTTGTKLNIFKAENDCEMSSSINETRSGNTTPYTQLGKKPALFINSDDTLLIPAYDDLTIDDFVLDYNSTLKYTADNIIDAEKSYMLDGDDSLCWAAVCSNMLTYTGISVHEGTDHVHQEDATMDYYAARYNDGYVTVYGLMDYIEDNNINTDNIDLGYVKFSNGKTNLDEISGFLKDDYAVSFYMLGTSFVGHGVTCWGITKNEDGYTGVVITDSDDEETEDPKTAPNSLRLVPLVPCEYVDSNGTVDGYRMVGYDNISAGFIYAYDYLKLLGVEDTDDVEGDAAGA